MRITQKEAVTKMAAYINRLAALAQGSNDALHVKQARVNRLVKLSAELTKHKDIVVALKQAYPEKSESERCKLAFGLIQGLSNVLKKQAMGMAHSGSMQGPASMMGGDVLGGMMGAGGGAMPGAPAMGGDGGVGPAMGGASTAAGTSGGMPMGSGGLTGMGQESPGLM